MEVEIKGWKQSIEELVVIKYNVIDYIKWLEISAVILANSNKELVEFENTKKLANNITIRI